MAHRVRLEQLESRCVLSANLVATSASLVDASGIALSKANIGEQVFARLSFQVTDLPFGATYQIAYSLDGVTHLSDALDFKAGVPGTWSGTWRLGDGWFASPGSHVMEITIDSANTVAESNEADNVFAFTFAPQPPSDLPSKFVLPIGGERGMDWQIGNYVDVNVLPGPDNVSDFRGGRYTYDSHDAWDIGIASFAAMDHGVPVFAAAPGVVVEVQDGEFDRWTAWQTPAPPANHVIVDHGNGWRTLYWHLRLSSISVRLNQTVAAGEFLGYVGSSGYSTGPHLHFGVQHRGASVETAYAPAEYWITPPIYTGDVLPSILDYGVSNYDVGEDLTQKERPAELSAFSTASAQNSTTWAHFSGIRQGDSITFRWYRPDDTLYAQDGLVANNDSADPTFYYGTILPSPPDVGVWWARWFVNGNLLAERPFNVTAAGSSSVQVQLSSTIVADGRTTPLRLGNVALGDAAPSVHFTIENKGPATLTASVASLPAGVELEGGFPESIPPHESRTFSLRLNTSAPRDIRGNVVLSTNDPNAQVYSFAVSGTVTGPQLEVRLQNGGVLLNGQSSIDFGTLVAGQRDPSREIVLRNTGSESLNLSDWEMSDSGFAFDGLPPDSLEPGQSATLRVQMNASTPGHKSSQVSFRTNSQPLFRIELNGVVTAVPDTTDADFHILALIYRNATIGGTPSTMDDATIKAVTEGVQAQVPTFVNQLTGGQVQVRVHVEVVDRALATIKIEDDGTYGGARDQDIAPELDRLTRPGWYDDIYVFHPFFTATIGPAWSGNSPARDGMRVATLNFSRPGGVLQSNDVPGMIHEWLHGLDGQYFEERHVPRPHYSDGGDLWLHSTNKYGYNAPLESRPEWAAWYGDYLTDGIRDINQNGLNTGYGLGPDAWAYGVPRNDQPYVPGSPLELPDKNTTTTQYVSDLYWASSQGEWLPARRDRTVNDRSIEINGVRYAKGVGVHANSEIIINLRGAADRFQSAIGVDDDVPATNGSVVFKVFGDGGLLYRSGVMTGAMSALPIDVPVTGVQQLRLVVENAGDGNNSDNASWADARLTPFAGVFASDLAWRTSTVVGNTIYLSDTNWTSSHTDFDSIRRDAPLAGGPITIGGVAFGKGVSAHANSQIVVPLAGQATRFQSFIGVDDDALAQNGSVEFKVFGDGAILYQSGVVTGAMDAAQIDVNVTGVQELRLVVEDGGDGINFDHAAWADARFTFPSGSFPKDIGWTSTYLTLDKSTSRETISVGDTFYGKGIGMPPNAEIAIALGEQFSTFRSLIGIDDQVGDAGSVRFKVIVDGQVAYTSPRVTGAHTAIPVEVNVTGATEVRLQVLDDGDGSAFDHAVWALPYFTRAIAPSPELNLIGKGLSIQSADSSPSQLDGTDFGSVTQGGATVSRTFRVQNDGTATLNLTGLSVPAGFTVTNPLEPSLAPGAFDDIVVRLETSAVGTKSGEIQIFSNDGDESPFNFSITGIVVQPQLAEIIVFSYTDGLEVSDGDNTPSLANGTNFGSVTQGQLGPTTRFQVRNTGNATLALSNLTVPAGFTIVEPLVGSLGPGGIGDFTVQLDTSSPGTKSGEITFNTNDADENPFNFAITGNVTQPQLPEIIVFSYTNGEEVPDGDNTPRLADGTDFGSVTQGQAGPTTRFQVRNTGTSTLTLTNFTLPAGFLLFEPLVTSLGPGGIDDFTVQLDTSSPGTKSGQITFNTNDADENPFNFAITANVTPQEVTAPPERPDLAAASDSGLSDSDNLTNINNAPGGSPLTLVVPGTIPGAWVSLIVNGSFLMAKWADSGSSTSFSLPNEFDDGVYTFTAQQFQPDKLVSFPSPPLLVTIDTALPGATINTLPAVVAGATSYEFTVTYTDNSAIDVATIDSNDVRVIRQTGGIALPVEVVSNSIVNVAGGVRATYRATPPGGVWDFVDNDTYTVHVQSGQVADTGGNVVSEKQATFQVDFTNQRTPPPGLPDLAASSDTGILNSDNITNINSQPATPIEIVVPNTVPGAEVSLYSFGDLLTSKTADSSGSTTFFLHFFFTDYTYIFTARQRSPGELISVSSPELAITFDTTPPAPPVLSLDHILATRPNGLLFSDDPRTQLIVLAPVGGFVLDEVYYLSPENNFSNAAPATIISQGTFGYFPFAPDPVQFALDISQAFPQTRDGFYFTYYSKVIDIAGNPSEVSSLTIARDATPPTAQPIVPSDVTTPGQSKVSFSVTFTDDQLTDLNGFAALPPTDRMIGGFSGVQQASINAANVQIVAPSGNTRPAQRVSTTPTADGRGFEATYEFDAPGGTWTFANNGDYTIRLLTGQVTDFAGNAVLAATTGFRISVPDTAPVLAPIGDLTIDELSDFAKQLSATSPLGLPLTYSMALGPDFFPGNLPTISPSGQFNWLPFESDNEFQSQFVVRFFVSDTYGQFDDEIVQIDVNEVNQAPLLSSIPAQQTTAGTPFALSLAASDLDLPAQALSWGLSGGPANNTATINPVTGVFNWTPTNANVGQQSFTVTVTDDGVPSLNVQRQLVINVQSSGSLIELGTITSHQIADVAVPVEGVLYHFTSSRNGQLTLEATFDDALGSPVLRLLNQAGAQLALASTGNGTRRIDVTVPAGTGYFLAVEGAHPSVDLRLTNALTQNGSAVTLVGGEGNDQLEFAASDSFEVSLNGARYLFPLSGLTSLTLDGQAGNDSLILQGSAGDEVVNLGPGSAARTGGGLTLSATSTERITAMSGGGFDRADFVDSSGDDQFVARPDSAQLAGASFFNRVTGFDTVRAVATTGNDQTTFYDSAGDDQFVARPDIASLAGAGYFNQARGFDSVRAFGSTGVDKANLNDSPENDQLVVRSTESQLTGQGFFIYAKDFDEVRAFASTGRDTATMYDSNETDRLVARTDYTQLSNTVFLGYAKGFDEVRTFAGHGFDIADLYDSEGNDILFIRGDIGQMTGPGFFNYAQGFDSIRSYASTGNDQAQLYGGGDDQLDGSATYLRLQSALGTASVNGFDSVRAVAGAGVTKATLHDTVLDDHLDVQGTLARLLGTDYSLSLYEFQRVVARSTAGRDTSHVEPHDFVLEFEGNWLDDQLP